MVAVFRFSRCAAVLACTLLQAASAPPANSVPFTIEATEDVSARFPGAPHLQSFAWAQWEGKWIFITGRTSGYHGAGGKEADFPRSGANDKIWMIEPPATGAARVWGVPLNPLPESLRGVKDQFI